VPPATSAVRFVLLLAGFFLLAYGSAMVIEAHLGVAPWTVLHLGLAGRLPLTVGMATQLVGLAVLLGAVALGVRPRLGTWLNMLMVGFFLDMVLRADLVPAFASGPARWVGLLGGNMVATLGIATYLSVDLGAGPRDSLMLGLVRVTGRPVAQVRSTLELAVVGTGYLLGGPVGAGTVASALLAGPAVQAWLAVFWLAAGTRTGSRLLRPPVPAKINLLRFPFLRQTPGG